MVDKKYQVFISSTYSDLIEERRKILDILLMADCIPAGMEAFVATDTEQFEVIKKVIDLCDYYVLIIGKRYGSVNPDTGLSYTEMEYDYAKSQDMPVLVFAIDNSVKLADEKEERDSKKIESLERFRLKAMSNRLASIWKTPDELTGALAISIMRAKAETKRPGWQRATNITNTYQKNNSQKKELLKFRMAGIENVFLGRPDMQNNGFAVKTLLNNIQHGSKIYVFSRTARAYSEEYKLLQQVMETKDIHFTFVLPTPDIETFDNRGRGDLQNTLSLFEEGIYNKKNLDVFLVQFYTTYSFVLIETKEYYEAILDIFIDLPYDMRHTISLKRKKPACEPSNDFIDSLLETKTRYIGAGQKVDFTKTTYNKKTGALVFR